jgi:P4 family phage/plasmid primase-like protien
MTVQPKQKTEQPKQKRGDVIRDNLFDPATGEARWRHCRQYYEDGSKRVWWETLEAGRWHMGLNGRSPSSLPLWNAHRIREWPPAGEIIAVEGEMAGKALAATGYHVVATVTGAPDCPDLEVLSVLRGRALMLWRDHDAPGAELMRKMAERLYNGIAIRIRWVDWKDAPPKGDAADFIRLHGAEAVRELLAQALLEEPPLSDPGAEDETPAYPRRRRRRARITLPTSGPPLLADGFPATDLGNAERFVERVGGQVAWNPAWGWLAWDGARWTRDVGTPIVRDFAGKVIRYMYGTAQDTADVPARLAIAKHAEQSEARGRIDAMLSLAEPACFHATDEFDCDGYLLNCPNGTVDLRTGQLREHRRDDWMTKVAGAEYDPQASCPRWFQFLDEIMAGDVAKITFLQELAGLGCLGAALAHAVFILWGTGANGKSVFYKTVQAALGDYAVQTDSSTFMVKKIDGGIPNDLARLAGARLVTTIELEEGKRLAEALLKQLTGGDRIPARFLYKEFFEFDPVFTPVIITNHKPVVRGTDHAIWRRIHLVPFTVTFPEAEQDLLLTDTLRKELPGVLTWAVRGAVAVQQDGRLRVPDTVRTATAEFRAEMDTLRGFLEECCEIGKGFRENAGALYGRYKAWAEHGGEYVLTQTAFGRGLTERGFAPAETDDHKKIRLRLGVRLRG